MHIAKGTHVYHHKKVDHLQRRLNSKVTAHTFKILQLKKKKFRNYVININSELAQRVRNRNSLSSLSLIRVQRTHTIFFFLDQYCCHSISVSCVLCLVLG